MYNIENRSLASGHLIIGGGNAPAIQKGGIMIEIPMWVIVVTTNILSFVAGAIASAVFLFVKAYKNR